MSHMYLTDFDINYAIKGVAMIRSLLANDPDSIITVICLDKECFRLLVKLAIPELRLIPLSGIEVEDTALLLAKANRSLIEYYWTLTPTIILRFIQQMKENDILTYIDADLLFFSSPQPIFDELGDNSVFIHGHNFPSQYKVHAINGLYNVGWLSFRNDADGRRVLVWWRDCCLEWCYNRCENGKMGDQKYLESFHILTDKLVISKNPGVGVAPWNVIGYKLSQKDNIPYINGRATIFFHYHGATQITSGLLILTTDLSYSLPLDSVSLYYLPYLDAIDKSLTEINAILPELQPSFIADKIHVGYCIVGKKKYIRNLEKFYPCILPLTENDVFFVSPQLLNSEAICGPLLQEGEVTSSQ